MQFIAKKILYTSLIILYAQTSLAGNDVIFKSGFETSFRLNDTGVTWGADYLGNNNATCSSDISVNQDCNSGRDVDNNDDTDGKAGFSFTKLDASGAPLVATALTWSCVKDNVTGLIWEAKTSENGLHNQFNTYQWGGVTHMGSTYGTYYNDWDILVNGSNTDSYCGINTWRIPNVIELMSISDLGVTAPRIDTDYFPYVNGVYWTSYPGNWDETRATAVTFATSNAFAFGAGLRTQVQKVILVSH